MSFSAHGSLQGSLGGETMIVKFVIDHDDDDDDDG